jgi:hypothetical protein
MTVRISPENVISPGRYFASFQGLLHLIGNFYDVMIETVMVITLHLKRLLSDPETQQGSRVVLSTPVPIKKLCIPDCEWDDMTRDFHPPHSKRSWKAWSSSGCPLLNWMIAALT